MEQYKGENNLNKLSEEAKKILEEIHKKAIENVVKTKFDNMKETLDDICDKIDDLPEELLDIIDDKMKELLNKTLNKLDDIENNFKNLNELLEENFQRIEASYSDLNKNIDSIPVLIQNTKQEQNNKIENMQQNLSNEFNTRLTAFQTITQENFEKRSHYFENKLNNIKRILIILIYLTAANAIWLIILAFLFFYLK